MEILTPGAVDETLRELGISSTPLPSSQSDELRETMRAQGKKSLYFFCTAVLGWDKLRPQPHRMMCDFLQAPHSRKVLLVPRDTFKSTIASKSLPLWILIQDEIWGLPGPEHRQLLCSHSSVNASKQIRSLKSQVERNELLQWLYPEIIPDFRHTKWTDTNLLFPRKGAYGEDTIESAGIDTHIVSRHYTVMIKDDLEDHQSFESAAVREKVKNWDRAAEALFVSEREAVDIYVGTRWGTNDLYSDIQANLSDEYSFLCRPIYWDRALIERDNSEAAAKGRKPVYEMIPDRDAPDPQKTYYFFEELFPQPSIDRLRKKQGTFMFSMLYMNNPYDDELREFKPSWIKECWWSTDGDIAFEDENGMRTYVPLSSTQRVMMWDPALSEKKVKDGCRNAIVVMARDRQQRLFVLEAFLVKHEPTRLIDKFIGFQQRYLVSKAAIDGSGFQRILKIPLYARMQELDTLFPVQAQPETKSKETRIRSLIPYVESGQLYIRKGLVDFREEMENFPQFPLRDGLDAAAGCLELLGTAQMLEDEPTRRRRARSEQLRVASRSSITGY